MNILDEKVLLLNRLMQPLRLISVRRAFFLLSKPRRKDPSTKVATALEVDENHDIVGPVKWEDWLTLPVRPTDRHVSTAKQTIRVPSIIVLAEYDRVPLVEPNLTKVALWERQKGKDMYTLEQMKWDDCDMDHYIAQSKGGKTDWTNCGLTAIVNNRKKGDRPAHEVGLTLRIRLEPPKPKPMAVRLRRDPRFPEWDPFIR
jgi:5-methylcytosine-specific restriction endonuclease McrA